MSTPFIGEIKLWSFNFAPKGFAFCNGQLLPINQNQALFSLLGTQYGGDGRTTFALPDLRSRVPIHMNGSHPIGERAGEESHTLNVSEMPQHTHGASASSAVATQATAQGNLLGVAEGNAYGPPNGLTPIGLIASAGGSQAHENRQPGLTLNFCIALVGIFPTRN